MYENFLANIFPVKKQCIKIFVQMPDALHSSSRFKRLCSGALTDGRIIRLACVCVDLGFVPASSASRESPSFITGNSPLLRALADTRSFHILPSWRFQKLTVRILWAQQFHKNDLGMD